jgi:plastocyanin
MRSHLKVLLFAVATVAALTIPVFTKTGNADPMASQPSNIEVQIDNFSFSPPVLTIPPGTNVKWTNHDDVPHNVVSTSQKFKSKAMDTDESFSQTFTEPGTYEYFCALHPKMVGKVIVEGKGAM